MATRQSQIIINVDDKSLEELNQQIKDLQKNINGLKIGTTEWVAQNEKLGKLKDQFQTATTEAKKLQNVVQKVSGAEQLRSVLRLGTGMVGAFAGLGGVVKLLGGTGEKFEEIATKSLMLIQTMEGLGRLAEAFSATNLKGLANVGKGFQALVATVRGASTAMKVALISTGIGALIVAVGLIIANFDKIKNLFSGQKKIAEETYKRSQEAVKLSEQQYQTAQKEVELTKQRGQLNEKSASYAEAEAEATRANYDYINAQINEQLSYLDKLALKSGDTAKMTDEERKAAEALTKEKLNTLSTEIQIADVLVKRAESNAISAKSTEKINAEIVKYQNRLTEISNSLYNQTEVYNKQRAILKDQLEIIEKNADRIVRGGERYTAEQKKQKDELNAQIIALDEQERLRKEALKNELIKFNYEKKYNDLIDDINSSFQIQSDLLKEEVNQYNEISTYFDKQIQASTDLNKQYELTVKKKEALFNFDKKGKEIFDQQTAALTNQLQQYDEIYQQTKSTIETQLEGKDISERVLEYNARELSLYKIINDAKIQKLEYDRQGYELEIKNLKIQEEQLNTQDKITQERIKYQQALLKEAQTKLEASKNDEERKVNLEKVSEIENQINELNNSLAENKTKILELNGQIISSENQILSVNDEINKVTDDTTDKTKETADNVEKQSRAYEKLQGFVAKYGEEIQTAQQLIGQSFEMVSAFYDRKAQKAQEHIDDYNKQLSDLQQKESERNDQLQEWEEELKDANGDRYNELLKNIEAAKAAEIQSADEIKAQKDLINANIKKEEDKKLEAEYQAAKWRKVQAVIDATIAGALAVVKALPNLVLSILVGSLSAASIATIMAQKLPPRPDSKKIGGYTIEGNPDEVAGVVHKSEYIIPAKVVKNPAAQAHIAALEEMRIRGYQGGGLAMPNLPTPGSQFDYDRLIVGLADAISKMPNPQVGLVDISNGIREVTLTKQNASLTR